MSPDTLRAQLHSIALNGYQVPEGLDPFALAGEMMGHIGTPDAELRDELIYMTLAHWISRGVFDDTRMRVLLARSLDEEHLLFGLGELETDSVFTRAFSVLLLPPILQRHREGPFLHGHELRDIRDRLTGYLRAERDLRGYVKGRGWAHAMAHSADALGALAQCAELGRDGLLDLLGLIRETAGTMRSAYVHGEDERLAEAALQTLIRRELAEEDVAAWLEGFREAVQHAGAQPLPEGYRGFINLKHFLRALYFRLRRSQVREAATEQIEGLLEDFSRL